MQMGFKEIHYTLTCTCMCMCMHPYHTHAHTHTHTRTHTHFLSLQTWVCFSKNIHYTSTLPHAAIISIDHQYHFLIFKVCSFSNCHVQWLQYIVHTCVTCVSIDGWPHKSKSNFEILTVGSLLFNWIQSVRYFNKLVYATENMSAPLQSMLDLQCMTCHMGSYDSYLKCCSVFKCRSTHTVYTRGSWKEVGITCKQIN